jgi:hypothetical protein
VVSAHYVADEPTSSNSRRPVKASIHRAFQLVFS